MLIASIHTPLQVLVVDDDPMCLKVVSAMLKRCNYEGTPLPAPCTSITHTHSLHLATLHRCFLILHSLSHCLLLLQPLPQQRQLLNSYGKPATHHFHGISFPSQHHLPRMLVLQKRLDNPSLHLWFPLLKISWMNISLLPRICLWYFFHPIRILVPSKKP